MLQQLKESAVHNNDVTSVLLLPLLAARLPMEHRFFSRHGPAWQPRQAVARRRRQSAPFSDMVVIDTSDLEDGFTSTTSFPPCTDSPWAAAPSKRLLTFPGNAGNCF